MNKDNNIRYLIVKVYTDDDLIEIQKIAIENGYGWPTGGKIIAYRNRDLPSSSDRKIYFIIFEIKYKTITYRDDENYLDEVNDDLDIDNDDQITIFEDIKILKHYFKYGITKRINYNEPKKLVYESYNDENSCTEICIKVNNDQELKRLSDIYDSLYPDFKSLYTEFKGILYNGLYVFLNFKYHDKTFLSTENGDSYRHELNTGKISEDDRTLNNVYYKVFDIKKDYYIINSTLKQKKLVTKVGVEYNEPKKLIYESNNIVDIEEICVKVNNDEELEELENVYKTLYPNTTQFNDYFTGDYDYNEEVIRNRCRIFDAVTLRVL